MRPYDALTDEDIKTIQYYLEIYGATRSAPLFQVLNVWNINKSTLFKAFGKKLRIEKQISIPKDIAIMKRQLSSVYDEYPFKYEYEVEMAQNNKKHLSIATHNEFIADVLYYWANQNYNINELYILSRLFSKENVSSGYIDTISNPGEFKFSSFKATIKNGMKTIRTIQKLLKITHYSNMELFEEWRNAVNCISIGNEIQAKLVLSIHPLDFMSMSDNNCNWSSCMSWSHNGSYRGGTLEMMNSNLAIVAYLEGPQTFKLNISEDESYVIPNKSWRSLFYVHKNILLSGKSYPYHNDKITFEVLDMLKDLVKENLNWDYQFGIQEYQDMKNLDGNFYVRDFFNTQYDKKKNHHCIFVYTNCMYNDIIESHNPYYYCYRNYVPRSIKLCLSGPPTCICCGAIMGNHETIYDYDDIGSDLICGECYHNKHCSECGTTNYYIKYKTRFGNFCNDRCCDNYIYFPGLDRAISKEDAFSTVRAATIIFDHQGLTSKQLDDIRNDFLDNCFSEKDTIKFINRLRATYGESLSIRRISETLNSPRLLYISSYQPVRYTSTYREAGSLYVFKSNKHSQNLEQKIEQLKDRISLLDYLKEGGTK